MEIKYAVKWLDLLRQICVNCSLSAQWDPTLGLTDYTLPMTPGLIRSTAPLQIKITLFLPNTSLTALFQINVRGAKNSQNAYEYDMNVNVIMLCTIILTRFTVVMNAKCGTLTIEIHY